MLVGRDPELARIDSLLADARRGHGGAILLTGEAGVGKTALLEAASSRHSEMRQLKCAGFEAESSLPFSALAELTEHLRDGIPELPAPQARAIEGALALAPPAPGDRFAVCAGFLGLLSRAAEHEPLIVIVDDTQWLDRASAECLGYAARRVDEVPIAFLAAARSADPQPISGPRIEQLDVARLDRESSRAVLEALPEALAPSVAESLIDACDGNALALIELPSLLSPEERRGAASLDHPLPAGLTLQRAFEERIARLPTSARNACLVAAAAFAPNLGPIQAACRAMGVDPSAREVAEEQGVVELFPVRVEFDHPLLRGAVYRGVAAAERRSAHRALADSAEDADSRAWHLAAAAVGPDVEAAGALEAAATRASARGAHGAAADALERAARLSEDRAERTRRLLTAGLAAAIGGAYQRGVVLMELAGEIDDVILRTKVRQSLAMTTLNGGLRTAHSTHQMLVDDAERVAESDPDTAAAVLADAALAAAVAGNCGLILSTAERAVSTLPGSASPTTRCRVLAIQGLGLALAGRTRQGRDALDAAGALLDEVDPVSPAALSVAFALGGRRCTGQEALLGQEAARLEQAARDVGAIGLFPYFQLMVADCAFRTGAWETAAAKIAEAAEGAEQSGQLGSLSIALVVAARIHAARGDEEAARASVARALEVAEPSTYGNPLAWGKADLGFLELALDRIGAAIDELELVEALLERGGLADPLLIPWAPDLVEAYWRAGRSGDARRVAAKLSAQAENNDAPLAGALAARCEALVTDRSFDRAFERALELHERADAPFEQARTLLLHGARLHRARRRVEAREQLRGALAVFDRLGAGPWAERARAELRAAGGVERSRFADPDALTAQEIRVAKAVARGGTNREVAAELFLSPKTIDFHLGRIYRKLGIHSRAELATRIAAGEVEVS